MPRLFLFAMLLATYTAWAAESNDKPVTPYPTAHDAPLNAEEKLITATDTYQLYRVEFNGIKEGSRVPANLYVPRNADAKTPCPAVLLQYGSGGNKNTFYIVEIGKLAVAKGMVVLTIDVPGRGERKDKDEKLNFLDSRFPQFLGDYSRATDYLTTRKDVDPKRLSYVGISWGAITGVTYAAHDPRIGVVASLVGGGNFAGLVPGIPEDIRKGTERFDPYYHVAQIAPRPLLLMNVLHDQLVPKFMAESLQKAAPEGAKKIWIDSDHFFNGTDRVALANSVLDFVLEHLPKSK